jgi:hypothetical protein
VMEQSYGSASFLQAGSSSNGRCWFVVQREVAQAGSPVAITGFTAASGSTPSTLTAVASNFATDAPTAAKFTTSGTLPATSPALLTTRNYWVVGVTANTFKVFDNQADALDDVNSYNFTSAGTSSNVVGWPLTTIFTLEELTNEVYLDCAVEYNNVPTGSVTTQPLFNAQDVKMIGDGYGFSASAEDNVNNTVVFEAHGEVVLVSHAFVGFPIRTVMEPMPLNISSGPSAKESVLVQPKHIRFVNFMFNNTIGGTINGIPIALKPFESVNIGEPPTPARGVFQMSIMKGWDDFNNPTFTIEHDDPFDIQLLGAFYMVDI